MLYPNDPCSYTSQPLHLNNPCSSHRPEPSQSLLHYLTQPLYPTMPAPASHTATVPPQSLLQLLTQPLYPLAVGPVHPRYPLHPLLQDLYNPGTPYITCSRTCTTKVPLISLASGPVQPRYPLHPLLQDLYNPVTPHIPCSRTCTTQLTLTSLAPGPVQPSYPSYVSLRCLAQGPLPLHPRYTPHVPCSRTSTPHVPLTSLAPGPVYPRYPSHTATVPSHIYCSITSHSHCKHAGSKYATTQLRTSKHWKVGFKSFPTVYDMPI